MTFRGLSSSKRTTASTKLRAARTSEVAHVPGMEQIEAAVRENDALALSLERLDLLLEVGGMFDLISVFFHGSPPVSKASYRRGRRERKGYAVEVRAKTRQSTESAPARFSAFAHSFSVLPVVATSSTNRIVLPLTSSRFTTSKAFRTFLFLSSLLSVSPLQRLFARSSFFLRCSARSEVL